MLKVKSYSYFLFSILALVFSSCGINNKKTYDNSSHYNFNEPIVTKLPMLLDEISGLSYREKDNSIFAIADDSRAVFKIANNEVTEYKFKGSSDFEDVVLMDSTFYVLKSNGDIYEVKFNKDSDPTVNSYTFPKEEYGKSEFEILYKDTIINTLTLICKDCRADKKTNEVSSYIFDIATKQFSKGFVTIDENAILKITNTNTADAARFKPSAASINPIDGSLYIVSSINKCIVVASPLGEIKNVYRLDAKKYKQPEGIAFKPNGDMYISNESAGIGAAELLYIPYQKLKINKK